MVTDSAVEEGDRPSALAAVGSTGGPSGSLRSTPACTACSGGEAWTAGLEMGRLDAQLAARLVRTRAGLTVRASNARVAEEIAGRHGYRVSLRHAGEPDRVWAELWPDVENGSWR